MHCCYAWIVCIKIEIQKDTSTFNQHWSAKHLICNLTGHIQCFIFLSIRKVTFKRGIFVSEISHHPSFYYTRTRVDPLGISIIQILQACLRALSTIYDTLVGVYIELNGAWIMKKIGPIQNDRYKQHTICPWHFIYVEYSVAPAMFLCTYSKDQTTLTRNSWLVWNWLVTVEYFVFNSF